MKTATTVTLVLLATLASTGCLRSDTTHTLYLSPDGAVWWMVEESDVRSDESDDGKRVAEEQSYIAAALIGEHPMARGLRALEPAGPIRTIVGRDDRPFRVITDAPFTSVDRALRRLFAENGLPATVALVGEGDQMRLHMRLDFSRAIDGRDTPAAALLQDFTGFTFVLTSGRFVPGGGFDLPHESRAQISAEWIARADDALAHKRSVDLVLTWTLP